MTKEDKQERERRMFGCTADELRDAIENPPFDQPRAMLAMSVLSDAQSLIELGNDEGARQAINRGKFIVGEYLSTRGSDGRMV